MRHFSPLTVKMALQLAAPHTWVASIVPVLFGILFCKLQNYFLSPIQNFLLLIACIFMQAAVNSLNDYTDFMKGNDSIDDYLDSTDAVLIYNNVNPTSVLILAILYLIIGCCAGTIGVIGKGILPFLIGGMGALVVILYSCGNISISYLPIGEFISGLVMGILIPLGVAAAADGKFHEEIIFYAIPLFLGIALIMMTNNGCDIEKDKKVNRLTLPVLIGRNATQTLYHILVIIWIFSLITIGFILLGMSGIIIVVGILLFQKKFIFLLKTQLFPESRIVQMKEIVIANLIGNGCYLIAIFFKIYKVGGF